MKIYQFKIDDRSIYKITVRAKNEDDAYEIAQDKHNNEESKYHRGIHCDIELVSSDTESS